MPHAWHRAYCIRRGAYLVSDVAEPEAKRKIIGAEFVRVFEEEARKVGDEVSFLAQGTITRDCLVALREGRRAYDWPCVIRCINTVDVMTAEVPELDWALLKRITARVTAEAPGICRVCYGLTPKPVGTVEWE